MNIQTKEENLKSEGKEFYTFQAFPENAKSAVIVIEEIWGLTEHIKDITRRIAAEGYYALSPELLAETGILEKISPAIFKEMADPEKKDEAQKKMRDAIAPAHTPEFAQSAVGKLKTSFQYLKSMGFEKIGVIGFCFGGTYSYALSVNEPELKIALPFYGQAPMENDKITKINCPVKAFYGEQDARLVSQLPEVEKQMKAAKIDFEFTVYQNTGHAFFNDTNSKMYDKTAAEDAWSKVLKAFKAHL